jgi:small-conductance mechanosensitive channel/CRP-like cAMP-binding protein
MKSPVGTLISRLILPLILLVVVLALRVEAVKTAIFKGEGAELYLAAALVFALAFLIIRLLDALWVVWYARQKRDFPVPKVLHTILLVVLYLLTFFIVIRGVLGINITAFLATSALLTAILGLAFQGVLSNLLSGLSLHFTKSFAKGEWVGVGENEGVVIDTNWRETRIFDRFSNILVFPNNTMASEKITNYSRPQKRTALIIPVKVGFSAPPVQVFDALRQAAADVPDVLPSPEPEVQMLGYEDLGVSYAIKFWITDFARKFPIMAAVGKNIWYRFKRQGIEIPVPLNDQLKHVLGKIPALQDEKPAEVREERLYRSLLQSSLFRYESGDSEGELLLPEDEIRRVARSVSCQRYAAGEVLFRQGDKGNSCFVVTDGLLKGEIAYLEKGKKYTSEFKVEPYGIFGEMSLFTGMPRTAKGTVEVEAELIEIKLQDFAGLIERNPQIAEVMADLVSRRNQENQAFLEKIQELSAQDIQASTNKNSILNRLKSLIHRNA